MQVFARIVTGLAALAPTIGLTQTVIGIVSDGPIPAERSQVSIAAIASEFDAIAGDEFVVEFPDSKRIEGDWTQSGVRAAVENALADPEIDIVLTTGLVAGSEASRIENLSKPVIAIVVADHVLQRLPFEGDASSAISGKGNFVYLSDFGTIDDEIRSFHQAVDFSHMSVFVDELTYVAVENFVEDKAAELELELGITIDLHPVTSSAAEALSLLSPDSEAVYVTPLLRFNNEQMRQLSSGLLDRRLPSFSLLGLRELVQYDFLMATSGRPEDATRLSRRVALNLERILSGQDAGSLEILFRESRRPIINMAIAEAISFAAGYHVLIDAEQIPEAQLEGGEPLSLAMALEEALDANLNLKVAALTPRIAEQSASQARSALRPQLGIGAQNLTIDKDRANPIFQSERSVTAELSVSQVIFAEDARAAARVAERLANAANHEYAAIALDTVQSAARAYLNVLRARARERVQRRNLEVTRENLELAVIRERIGYSGRADRLRWQSQLATERQNVIAAESERRGALTALNRILNRPQNQDFTAPAADVLQSIGIFEDDQFQRYVTNALVWEVFQDFSVGEALESAPELQQIDELIAAQQRQLLASERKHWLPELSLGANRGSVVSRGGAGSDLTGTGIDDESWSVSLNASLPLFSGGAIRAQANADRLTLTQLEQSRDAMVESIEARTRLALHRAAGSYPAIDTAAEAHDLARENYELVSASYSEGLVSVTELIDAQNAANVAELRATDTRYAALIDIIDVFRSSGDFSIFLDSGSSQTWFLEIEQYFQARGVEP